MTSGIFSLLHPVALLVACLAYPLSSPGQSSGVITASTPQKVIAKRNNTVEAKISVRLHNGYHVNSNTPKEDYLIPLRLRWDAGPLEAIQVRFPKAELRNYQFSSKPVSVFAGDFDIVSVFKVAQTARPGQGVLTGKLRYQACNDNSCLPPRTLDIRLPYSVQ